MLTALLVIALAVVVSVSWPVTRRVWLASVIGAGYLARWFWHRSQVPAWYAKTVQKDYDKPTGAELLRRFCEDMGPVFVKFGQIIGSSAGLFPEAVVAEFGKCLDRVKPIPFADVEATLSQALGELAAELSSIDPTPLASASIAQVHAATLEDGTSVVLKVQRPGIEQMVESDIQLLRWLAKGALLLFPSAKIANPLAVVEDFAKTLQEELDFRQEAENLRRFNELAKELGYADIRAPVPQADLTTRRVLVMERFHGVRVDDVVAIQERDIDAEEMLIRGLRAWFQMVVRHGFFHGDVHAGNLLLLDNGDIGFLDFGIVGRFDSGQREQIGRYLTAMVVRDFGGVADVLCEMTGATPSGSRDQLIADLERAYEPLLGASIANIDPAELAPEINRIAVRHGFVLPREFVLITKQILYFDRYARLLAPDLNLFTDPRLVAGLAADVRGSTLH